MELKDIGHINAQTMKAVAQNEAKTNGLLLLQRFNLRGTFPQHHLLDFFFVFMKAQMTKRVQRFVAETDTK